LMPDECDGLSVWGDLGIAVALSRKRVGRQAQAGKIRGVIPHEEDSVSAGTVDAFVNEVMSIGSEGRLGMKTCRRQIVKIGAIGIDDRDPPVRVIVEGECDAPPGRRPVRRVRGAVYDCELKPTRAVRIDGVKL